MRKLLAGLLLLGSMSSFANDSSCESPDLLIALNADEIERVNPDNFMGYMTGARLEKRLEADELVGFVFRDILQTELSPYSILGIQNGYQFDTRSLDIIQIFTKMKEILTFDRDCLELSDDLGRRLVIGYK
jgi:hypothetical protein